MNSPGINQKTIRAGSPIGLLLSLTYSATFTVDQKVDSIRPVNTVQVVSPNNTVLVQKPMNTEVFDEQIRREKTLGRGTPMGLLLALTYPTDIVVVA